jgi:hypothetical protein
VRDILYVQWEFVDGHTVCTVGSLRGLYCRYSGNLFWGNTV